MSTNCYIKPTLNRTMKKFLLAAVAVFIMAGNSFAADAEGAPTMQVSAISINEENVIDKFVALINSYTKKVKAAKDQDELLSIANEFVKAVTEFEKNSKAEIEALEERLTEAQAKEFENALNKAMDEYTAAVTAKLDEFGI